MVGGLGGGSGASASAAKRASATAIDFPARTAANLQVVEGLAAGPGGDTCAVSTEARMRVALAQVNPTVGDVDGNAAMVSEWARRAEGEGADLTIFPELCVTGYPAEDLYLKRHFVEASRRAVEEIAAGVGDATVLVGFAEPAAVAGDPRRAHNSLAVLREGELRAVYRKMRLPNYAVFDEQRYFVPGSEPLTVEVAGTRAGLTICEDCWVEGPPAADEVAAGATLIANPSGSPYHRGKGRERERLFTGLARAYGAHFAFCNLVGGQDELVFDGQSFVLDPEGGLLAQAAQFEEELLLCEVPSGAAARIAEPLSDLDEVYAALALGLRDYVRKNGFRHVGIALSGGIDSALVAVLAADALGPENVTCVVMPSPHSSQETQSDARNIAASLGVEALEIPIEAAMEEYERALGGQLLEDSEDAGPEPLPRDPARPSEPDLAAENIQARIRGNLMMALSNKHGWLVLTTGNKSEMSVGYATLYGDMAGGFAVIKDVPKTLVYELVRRRNERAGEELVPASVLRAAAVGRAAPRSARQRLAASVRPSRPHPRGIRRARRGPRGDDRRGAPRRGRRRGRPPRRPVGVQAPPGGAGDPHHAARLRPRPPAADHQPLRRLARAHGDGHLREGAGATLVVDDLRLPDPGGPPTVADPCPDLGVPLDDRAQEAEADRLAHRPHPLSDDLQRGRPRADTLNHRQHHAAVHQPERLAQLVAELDPGARLLGAVVEDLEPDQAGKMRPLFHLGHLVGHRPHPTRRDSRRLARPWRSARTRRRCSACSRSGSRDTGTSPP